MSSLTVRELTHLDEPLLKGVEKLLIHNKKRDGPRDYLGRYKPKVGKAMLIQNNTRKLVALLNDKDGNETATVVGFCTLQLGKSYSATLELIKSDKSLNLPCYIGQNLMALAEKIAFQEKAKEEMHLTVDRDNFRAIKFYTSGGWKEDQGRQSQSKYAVKELCFTLRRDGESFKTQPKAVSSKKRKIDNLDGSSAI